MYAKDGMRDIFSREPWRPDCWFQFQFDLVMVYVFLVPQLFRQYWVELSTHP